ncbi:MAG: nucleotide exchange factor GrpE [Gammaproteobacteria bacterium]|nr:nucleotide exchange factor GrpE [Gammaproteobacteria bacterium]MDE0366980.1 nucleotide exchange factor GrpE [Gammaproteobacteria bacterium]
MTDEAQKPAEDAAGEQDTESGAERLSDGEGERNGEPDSPESLQAALEAAREEAESARDAALRAQAETENVRRRATRDVENAHRFALERFAADLLSVADSLEKAVESAGSAEDVAAVAEGVRLSLKLFLDTLHKNGVEQVDPLGEPFDPSEQEAMAVVVNPDAEPNSVMEVIQRGYLLNGRVVRAAKVIVSKAPPGESGTGRKSAGEESEEAE